MLQVARIRLRTIRSLAMLVVVLALATAYLLVPSRALAAYKGFPTGQCTFYAAQEFDKIAPSPGVNWRGSAGDWYTNALRAGWAVTSNPDEAIPGSAIVWSGGGWGHVGVVREVTADVVRIDEMNWGAWVDKANAITVNHNKVTSRTIRRTDLTTSPSFEGFVLPMTIAEKLRLDAEEAANEAADKVVGTIEEKTDEALEQAGNAAEKEVTRQFNGLCGAPAALLIAPVFGFAVARKRRRP